MIYLLRYFKGISNFLVFTILFQSCVVYNQTPSTVKEASQYNKRLMQIKTMDGYEYKLDWIEQQNGNIVSILNTEREFIDKKEIAQIVLLDPEPEVISFDLALKNPGTMSLLIRDNKGRYRSQNFVKIKLLPAGRPVDLDFG